MTKQLQTIEKQIAPIIDKAFEITIKSADDMKGASETLSQLNQFNDKITEEKEKVTKPLLEALNAERSRWKPLETVYKKAIDYLRGEMSEYQTAEIKRQRDEEAKIAARVGDGKGKIKIETAEKKFSEIERVDEKVATESGLVKFREDKVLKVIDLTKIPREYFELNESLLLKDLKAGKTVEGAELEVKMVPVNFR